MARVTTERLALVGQDPELAAGRLQVTEVDAGEGVEGVPLGITVDEGPVLVLAVVLVFTVLLFEFRTFAAPTAIIASALLSTSGVFLALLVTGTTFNISSFMGLIMVIGIVAKNGILLLDADEQLRASGMDARQAMLQAAERRRRGREARGDGL